MSIDLISTGYFYTGIYALILFFFIIGILILSRRRDTEIKPVSVIIAARNEEMRLPELIEALAVQDYPAGKFEVLIIDDRSSDRTSQILKDKAVEYGWLRYASLTEENPALVGKKGALALGIQMAEHEILAFTDADCIPGRKWLSEINGLMTSGTDFLCGYSPLKGTSLINLLKNLERSSIFAVIAGSFGIGWDITSVARNQVYRKSRFELIKGFSGIGEQYSGDDDLLLQKMSRVIRKRNFIFDPQAATLSYDKQKIQDHIHLETRRASKWRLYPFSIKLMTLYIFIYYLLMIVILISTVIGVFPLITLIKLTLIKTGSEFLLLFLFLLRVRQLRQLLIFPLAELLYIPYYIYFGLRGTFGDYTWKK